MNSFRTIEISNPQYEGDLRFLTVKSKNLKGRGDICLFIPALGIDVKSLPIYILLHGVYGSAWIWAMKGGAAQMAKNLMNNNIIKPAIIAMPSDGLWGDGSAYLPHPNYNYEQWIVEDVPSAIIENIPFASKDSKICIAGLSMGGYGAIRLGAKYSKKFSAISGHSAITRLEQMTHFVEEPIEAYLENNEVQNLVDIVSKNKALLPPLRFDCGIDDSLIEANRTFHKQLDAAQVQHTYQEFAGGHEWDYWRTHLEKTYRFFDANI